jgi:hypothetical protein
LRRWLLAAGAAVVAALAGFTLWGPVATPAGQQPLTTLAPDSVGVFAAAFDRGADVPRLVLLLSPT